MKKRRSMWLFWTAVACLMVMLACSLPVTTPTPAAQDNSENQAVQQTSIALGIQSTMMVIERATLDAEIARQAAISQEQENEPTRTPEPTEMPPTPAPTEAVPTDSPLAEPTEDMEARIKGANILIFEDIQGYYDLDTRVSQAVNGLNFSGGKVVNVGDAIGKLMTHLNSPTKWDLIIISAEAHNAVRGEFWDVIQEQVNDGVALVAEVWYLNEIANGRIAGLLGQCGVEYQKDIYREADYEELNYSLYWLDQNHELFSSYNSVGPLYSPNIYWAPDDGGDLIRLGSGGDAQLLAGFYPNQKSSYGVLASCMEGRMILQTFCTHDYRRDQTVALWQNYIVYTLTNRFKTME